MMWSLLLFPSLAAAFNWSSLLGWGVAADQYVIPQTTPRGIRVAVVGAGAAGSSAAFWINKATERLGKDISIDVYERYDYIGGSESRPPKLLFFAASHTILRKYNCIPIQ